MRVHSGSRVVSGTGVALSIALVGFWNPWYKPVLSEPDGSSMRGHLRCFVFKEDTMIGTKQRTREELLEEVKKYQWVHSIDLGQGVITPGMWGMPQPSLQQAVDSVDFRGKKVLDIGCWDGIYSFMAERRGASEVYATDLILHRCFKEQPTFRLAHETLESRVKYFPQMSVYDVEELGINDFDVVIFAGVYYHLKEPMRAFTTLRRVMKEGGIMVVEGAVLDQDPPAPQPVSPNPMPPTWRQPRRFLRRVVDRLLPPEPVPAPPSVPHSPAFQDDDCYARFFYNEPYAGDRSNWWVPTIGCLRQWVECSFLQIEQEFPKWGPPINPRYALTARAVVRKDPKYCYPEADLRDYDLNEYD